MFSHILHAKLPVTYKGVSRNIIHLFYHKSTNDIQITPLEPVRGFNLYAMEESFYRIELKIVITMTNNYFRCIWWCCKLVTT